ncbi:MAG: fibronectin type III domain-containing protein [Thermoplasmata archaeon]
MLRKIIAILSVFFVSSVFLSATNALLGQINLSDAGLVGMWHFDENSGITVYDSSGNNNHGIVSGAVWATGLSGYALSFDGVNDIIDIPKSPSLAITSQITIKCWIKPVIPYSTNFPSIITSEYAWDRPEFVGGMAGSKSYAFAGELSDGRQFYISSGDLQNGVWYHLVGTYDGTAAKFYINGKIVGIQNITGTLRTPVGDLRIGDRDSDWQHAYPGIIDEVSIYSRAFSAEEVVADYMSYFPSAPQHLVALPGNSSVTLTWQPPASDGGSAITAYKVYWGTSAGNYTNNVTVGNITSYTIPNLTSGQTYYFAVSAINAAGEGAKSNEVSATPCTVPSAPQNLQATAGNGNVTLTWQPPASDGGSTITAYKIYWGTSAGNYTNNVTVGNITSYTITNLTNGQTYYFAISGINAAGESAKSNEVSATPQQPNQPIPGFGIMVVIVAISVVGVMGYWKKKTWKK